MSSNDNTSNTTSVDNRYNTTTNTNTNNTNDTNNKDSRMSQGGSPASGTVDFRNVIVIIITTTIITTIICIIIIIILLYLFTVDFRNFIVFLLGRDPGTLKSDIALKQKTSTTNLFGFETRIENSKIQIMETNRIPSKSRPLVARMAATEGSAYVQSPH